jgi:hypothetical protein
VAAGKVLGSVTLCGRRWQPEERQAVEDYRVALWNDFLATWPGVFTPMEVLEALGEFDQSVTAYLDIWAQTPGDPAARHLADFVSDFLVSAWSDRLFCHELDAWWAGGTPTVLLQHAWVLAGSPELAARFGEAIERVEEYRAYLAEPR